VHNCILDPAILDRLDAFQLELQGDGCPPDRAQSFRDDVHSAFNAAEHAQFIVMFAVLREGADRFQSEAKQSLYKHQS
jgi:hypothetical protein